MLNSIGILDGESSQDKVYGFIKQQILALNFKASQRLGAQEIATHLKISRTPVREALSRLEQEGLVRRDSGWGYVVRAMSFADVINLYKVREALEVEAVLEAIPFMNDVTLKQLSEVLKKTQQCLSQNRFEEFQSLNRQFHDLVAKATGNESLQKMLSSIGDKVRLVGAISLSHRKERAKEALEENRKILVALRKKDAGLAEEAVRNHIQRAAEIVNMKRNELYDT